MAFVRTSLSHNKAFFSPSFLFVTCFCHFSFRPSLFSHYHRPPAILCLYTQWGQAPVKNHPLACCALAVQTIEYKLLLALRLTAAAPATSAVRIQQPTTSRTILMPRGKGDRREGRTMVLNRLTPCTRERRSLPGASRDNSVHTAHGIIKGYIREEGKDSFN